MVAEIQALRPRPARSFFVRFADSRNGLGLLFMLPAAAILLTFLAYPLGLGFWLGLTDASIGEAGHFVGLANFISLAQDEVFRLAVFNTLVYTIVASLFKFALGL